MGYKQVRLSSEEHEAVRSILSKGVPFSQISDTELKAIGCYCPGISPDELRRDFLFMMKPELSRAQTLDGRIGDSELLCGKIEYADPFYISVHAEKAYEYGFFERLFTKQKQYRWTERMYAYTFTGDSSKPAPFDYIPKSVETPFHSVSLKAIVFPVYDPEFFKLVDLRRKLFYSPEV